MAKRGLARTRKPGAVKLPEEWRGKIQAAQILACLNSHALGKREMSATQIRAAEILLRKVLPDLSSIEAKSEVTHRYVARLPETAPTADEWQRQHAPESRLQ